MPALLNELIPLILPNYHSDQDLQSLLAQGEESAFRMLFEKHWDAIYSAALLLSKSTSFAEDVAQEVFTRLWEKRTEAAAIDNLQAYLYTAARNLIYTRLRKLASQQTYLQYIKLYFDEANAAGLYEEAESRDLEKTIHQAIESMPSRQQQAFRLSRFEGLSHEEIARLMGVSKGTVKSYIVQAIAQLRRSVAGYTGSAMVIAWISNFPNR